MSGLLLRHCELLEGTTVDVRIRADRIAEVAERLAAEGDDVIDGAGGALLPGLHDHHIHLLSLAAAMTSVRCGPPQVHSVAQLGAALAMAAKAAPRQWIRGVGYHESVAGNLDRTALDRLVATQPVRVQHRSGALWMLNSAALAATGLADDAPDGRLFRADHVLRARLNPAPADLTGVGHLLAGSGVTGVTDATPDLDDGALDALESAAGSGALPQRVTVLGAPTGISTPLGIGPLKIVLDEARGIDPAALEAQIEAAHNTGRSVAIHCVTVAEVVVAVDSISRARARHGDRLEHASELPPDIDRRVADLGLTVVTQPNFVAERGDEYLSDVDAGQHEMLYRCGSLDAAGIAVAGSTDAPFGDPDPWRAMQAAVDRRTERGAILGPAERLTPQRALALFLGPAGDPGGPSRPIATGARADLCLLHSPVAAALDTLDRALVRVTIIGGVPQYT